MAHVRVGTIGSIDGLDLFFIASLWTNASNPVYSFNTSGNAKFQVSCPFFFLAICLISFCKILRTFDVLYHIYNLKKLKLNLLALLLHRICSCGDYCQCWRTGFIFHCIFKLIFFFLSFRFFALFRQDFTYIWCTSLHLYSKVTIVSFT